MEIILIDQFTVQQSAAREFLEHVHFSARIVKTRPGFVEGYVYQRSLDDGQVNVITTAVWASESAMQEARKSIAAEFSSIGFDPPGIMQRLGVQMQRATYQRSPY
ncbi:MAG TPA: antibiotic biosynthesis monooxygenase [Steroidobacteraceae bacterium]|jgi:heme-degrading monooxygenase HmoA